MRRSIHIKLLATMMLSLLGCINQSMIKSPETAVGVSGTVNYAQHIVLPSEAMLHVILSDVSLPENPRAIAGQTIALPSPMPIQFNISYVASIIDRERTYSVQACIRFGDHVRLATADAYPVINNGHAEDVEVILEPVDTFDTESTAFESISKSPGSPLRESIHVTLAGECRISASRYDSLTLANASEILSTELLAGPYHTVRRDVPIRGPQYFFVIDSDFGQFQTHGRPRLRRLVREINAIAALKDATNTESYKDALKESALDPFMAFKDLVIHPVGTVKGIPEGLWTFVTASTKSVGGSRSQYEDRYLEALITVSKYKRRYAAELGIDVYTSSAMVQEELNRLGWAAAIANWTPTLVLLPASGTGKVLYSAFDWTKTLNRLITESAPDVLRYNNDVKLAEMGVSAELRKRFLSHNYYSPRNHTVITEHLASMKHAKERAHVIEQAIQANSEIDAFTYQQIIEILAGYHRSISPIIEFSIHKGIPVGYAENGALVMGFPVDIGRWTAFTEYLFQDFGKKPSDAEKVIARELWVLGELTPRARWELGKLGIHVTENADSKVWMMD
jgi:uncharacterized lipoprotein YbaY